MTNNELIAQFMGTEVKVDMMGNDVPDYLNDFKSLMSVCFKITMDGCTHFSINKFNNLFHVYLGSGGEYDQVAESGSPFAAIEACVLGYINSYNLTSKTPLA